MQAYITHKETAPKPTVTTRDPTSVFEIGVYVCNPHTANTDPLKSLSVRYCFYGGTKTNKIRRVFDSYDDNLATVHHIHEILEEWLEEKSANEVLAWLININLEIKILDTNGKPVYATPDMLVFPNKLPFDISDVWPKDCYTLATCFSPISQM